MKLSVITINYNNAAGLKKTMESVFAQNIHEFEYIVIDGASTDGSVEVIKTFDVPEGVAFHWISEPDSGIYNAMNKGIKMAKGEYLQFLNSGDFLAANDVIEKMISRLESLVQAPAVLYGNMMKQMPAGLVRDPGFAGRQPTMIDFYTGTLNHSPAYIRRDLFNQYGLYDENLKIVSDWKWYLQVVIFHGVQITYTDLDVTVFDMTGISSVDGSLDKSERKRVLQEILPAAVLEDYDKYAFSIEQINRINRNRLMKKIFYFVERLLFKWEKYF